MTKLISLVQSNIEFKIDLWETKAGEGRDMTKARMTYLKGGFAHKTTDVFDLPYCALFRDHIMKTLDSGIGAVLVRLDGCEITITRSSPMLINNQLDLLSMVLYAGDFDGCGIIADAHFIELHYKG